jgi:four helix bundle protein
VVVTAVNRDFCERAFQFASLVLDRYSRLRAGGPAESHVAQQLFHAVSSIGANLEEGQVANSRRDMAAKYAIALREAREARYWLRLLATRPGRKEEIAPLIQESNEFVAMLTVAVRRLRTPLPDADEGSTSATCL